MPEPEKKTKGVHNVLIVGEHGVGKTHVPSMSVTRRDFADIVQDRTKLHLEQLREHEKTKRTAMWISGMLVVAAVVVPVIAPEGRETMSYWLGAVLLLFAAGSAVYRRMWAKSPTFSMPAESDAFAPKDKLNDTNS